MREERVPLIRPCREFDLLGLSTRADVTSVGSVCLGNEVFLNPTKRRVKRAVMGPEDCKLAGDDLGDRHLRFLLKHNL